MSENNVACPFGDRARDASERAMQVPTLQRSTYMEKNHTHSNKDFGYSVRNDAIFTKHLTDLGDQINVLQKALVTVVAITC